MGKFAFIVQSGDRRNPWSRATSHMWSAWVLFCIEGKSCGAMRQLLLKEQKLLQTIDRLRLQADDENRDKRIRSTLQLMSAPKRWQMSDGEVCQVHTPFSTRAKELMELYNGLR